MRIISFNHADERAKRCASYIWKSVHKSLLLVSQNSVAVLTGADAPGVNDVADENTPVANITRMSYFQDNLDGWINYHVAAHNGQRNSFDDISGILYSTVDTLLTTLPDAMNVVVLKPVDVRREQGFLDLFKLGLSDNRFNLFHTLIPF